MGVCVNVHIYTHIARHVYACSSATQNNKQQRKVSASLELWHATVNSCNVLAIADTSLTSSTSLTASTSVASTHSKAAVLSRVPCRLPIRCVAVRAFWNRLFPVVFTLCRVVSVWAPKSLHECLTARRNVFPFSAVHTAFASVRLAEPVSPKRCDLPSSTDTVTPSTRK